MTTLRTAAQQALEALEYAQQDRECPSTTRQAIAALQAALAEPPVVNQSLTTQEPVAWRWGYRSVTTGAMDWRGYVEIPAHPNLRSPAIIMEPLYTAPPQRKPLTEENIRALYDQHAAYQEEGPEVSGWWDFARAIERAHGIGEQP